MARRIGLAQAMINDPAFLILDEPTSGLDPLGCREVKDLIKLLKKRGKTVIVTSHLLSDVEEVCDRIIVLYGGRIRANGGMEDLLTIRTNDTITVPRLPEEALERIRQIVRESVPDGEMSVAHPHMSLEDFFVDIVNEAKKESLETSGSRSGGGIAEYLAGDREQDAKAAQTRTRTSIMLIVFFIFLHSFTIGLRFQYTAKSAPRQGECKNVYISVSARGRRRFGSGRKNPGSGGTKMCSEQSEK